VPQLQNGRAQAFLMPPPIRVEFFSKDEKAVFEECLTKNFSGATDVVVKPLERFGYSGARVFVFYTDGEKTMPWIGKIHSQEGIQEELAGFDRAKGHFSDARQQMYDLLNAEKGILCISLLTQSGGSDPKVKELKDLLFDDPAKGYQAAPIKDVKIILNGIYDLSFKTAFGAVQHEECELGAQYKWYLRSDRARPLFQNFLGAQKNSASVQIYGRTYPNPLQTIHALLKIRRSLPLSTVHGDLHPSNVVIDGNGVPRLIDFSWCRNQAHILQDFLVMECSIRFLMSPRGINPQAQLLIDQEMLKAGDFDIKGTKSGLKKLGAVAATIEHVGRAMEFVQVLRTQASRACGANFDICDYLACQAIVLYGLCRVEQYPFGACANVIGLIGKTLHKSDYL
jgi:hypothetical protein